MAGEFEDLQIKVSVDASGAESGLNALSSSIDKVSEDIAAFGEGANFADAISQGCIAAVNDVENLDAVIQGVIDGMTAESIDIAVGVDATGASDALKEVDDSISKTQSSSEGLRSELSTPFVVTAGDAIDAFNNLGQSIINAENHVADFNKVSAGLSLIGGQTAQAYKDIAVGVSNEDMSIQQALETEMILSKQHVSSIDELKNLTEAWKNFGNANDEQASSLQQKLIPAWNQFGVTAQEQPKYFDALTTLFQTTNLSSSDFSSSIVRTGKDLSGFGLTLDQVAKLYLTMEESGYTGRKGMSALSGAITDINDNAEKMGVSVPKGDAALNALYKTIGISNDKVSEANKLFEASTGATDKWSEAMDKGDTSTEKMAAQVDKLTIGMKEAITPLAPVAAGVAGLASAGANLAIFDKFLAGGKISSGISGIAASLPLIGTAAAETEGGVVGLGTALGALGPITIAGAAIAAAGIAAYATNFGGFADNINESIALAQEAIQAFSEGDYEEAGKKMAESMASGFEALGDLLKDVIADLPELTVDAAKLLKGLKEGLEKIAEGAGEGAAQALQKTINSASIELNGIVTAIDNYIKSHPWNALGEEVSSLIEAGMNSRLMTLDGITSAISNAITSFNWDSLGNAAASGFVNGFITKGNPLLNAALKGFAEEAAGLNTQTVIPAPSAAKSTTIKPEGTTIINVPSNFMGGTAIPTATVTAPASGGTVSSLESGIAAYAKEKGLSTAQVTEMANASENFKKSLTSSGDAVTKSSEKQTDAISKSTESTSKQNDAIQKIISSSNDWDAFQDKMISAGYTQTEALDAWSKKAVSMSDTTDSLSRVQTKSSDRISSAADKTVSALDKVSKGTEKTTDNLQSLRDKYAEVSKIDPSIIAQMSREDLIRNIALYGEQIGGVNEQLGGSVDQLQKVAIEVSNIGATDAFSQIQNKFQDLKKQFESGAISQDQYLDGLRKASAETDTLSRSTNILKGSQKDAVLDFERNIKESLRRIESGTYGNQPISSIGESIVRLGGTTSGAASTRAISSIDKLNDAYVKQGISAGKAAALQFVLNDALSDGNVKLSEAYSYLGAYNQVTGQNADITQESARETLDMMNALQQANQLQSMYTDAMKEGGISAEEYAGIQGQQQVVQDALTQASQNALGPTGQLPGSLQAVADTVSAVLGQISNALANAQAAASQAQSAAAQAQNMVSEALSAASQVSASPTYIANIGNNQFGQTTTVKDVARNAFMAMGSF